MIEITKMANELMSTTFHYRGVEYNMKRQGWTFGYSTRKNALGTCKSRGKEIKLSEWMIKNSNENISVWKNTMLHEIAHAIDYTRRGTSSHDYNWKSIALSIGCDGKRTHSIDVDVNSSKYTMKCGTCGYSFPSHKRRKRKSSCGNCAPGHYDENFIMEQIQNY